MKPTENALQTIPGIQNSLNTQILLWINLFKILNIWTQVYYMQNYRTSHGLREIKLLSILFVCFVWACTVADSLARSLCCFWLSVKLIVLLVGQIIIIFFVIQSLLIINSGRFNFRRIRKNEKKKFPQ